MLASGNLVSNLNLASWGRPWACWLGVLGIALAGCTAAVVQTSGTETWLSSARMSPDAAGLDVFFIPLSARNEELYERLWAEVDEQVLSPQLRQRLYENGFRVGVVGAQLPQVLQQLLMRQGLLGSGTQVPEPHLPQLVDGSPRITVRHIQLRRGRRSEVVASGTFDELPVLVKDGQGVLGNTYRQCQGIFALRCFPDRDGSALVELVPELHYGHPRQVFSAQEGMWRVVTQRPREVYDHLSVEVKLHLGQMLILGAALDRPGTLGHRFFDMPGTQPPMRRVLLIRLATVQPQLPEPSAASEQSLP